MTLYSYSMHVDESLLFWLKDAKPMNLVRAIDEGIGSQEWSIDSERLARTFRTIAETFSRRVEKSGTQSRSMQGTIVAQCEAKEVLHICKDGRAVSLLVLKNLEARFKRVDVAVNLQGQCVVVQRDASELSSKDINREFKRESHAAASFTKASYIAKAVSFSGGSVPRVIVQEFCMLGPAVPLLLRRCSHLERAHLLRQAIIALTWVHEAGLVHCDVKSSNILLQRVSGALEVRLIDWGHSKKIGWSRSHKYWIGTYPAPEYRDFGRTRGACLIPQQVPTWARSLWNKSFPLDEGQDVFGLGLWVFNSVLMLGLIKRFRFDWCSTGFYSRQEVCSDNALNLAPADWRSLVEGLLAPNPAERLRLTQAKEAAESLITQLSKDHQLSKEVG